MFVLCPHCHFLVGMDPRTGGPPAACPKCGGPVVEPVAAKAPDAPVLDPFAQAALPSVAPTLPAVEVEADAGPDPKPVEGSTPASAHKRAGAVTGVAPASAKGAPAPSDSAKANAGEASPALPSADEMIAALATRPARKPRAPRTKKPAAAPASAPAGDADTPRPAAPPAPSSAPSAAATFGARLRGLFARAPRQADTAKTADAPAVAADMPPAAAADATPATPALSIRNRRRRTAAKAPDATGVLAPEVAAPASVASATSAATPASAVAVSTGTPAAPMPDAVARDGAPPAEATRPGHGQPLQDTAGADAAVAATPAGPVDAAVVPPENIDAAAAALVAAMPAQVPPLESAPAPARPAPSFARTQVATGTRRDYRAVAAAAALAGLLGLQLLLAQRAVLAADPGWRPTVAALCAVLRCELPPWREPAAFTMLSRHVRPHPDAPGTLLIDASFRNDARWPQPWPRLELTLADVDGRTVGARSFEAREYLGATPTQSELAPGQAASLSLAVVEPAPDIVSFTFDFR